MEDTTVPNETANKRLTRWRYVSIFFFLCTLYELLAQHFEWPQGYLFWLPFFLVFVVCTITDLRSHKIRNYWTYTATIWLIVTCLIFDQFDVVQRDFFLWPAPEFRSCLIGAVVCFLVLLLIYSLSGGGAGDVKLAAVVGAGLGLQTGLMALMYTYVFAAAWILMRSVWGIGPILIIQIVLRVIGHFLFPKRFPALSDGEKKFMSTEVPMAPFFASGVLFAFLEIAYLK